MKIAIVVGTRPEIIKMSPIIRHCQEKGVDFCIIHTGQHYSYSMDKAFFEELALPAAKYYLEVGSHGHGKQTGKILEKIEEVLIAEKPDVVLVEGDTNSVLAGALAAAKLHISVGHVEACLRSYDKTMPEEINRIVADHVSRYLFAPTAEAERTGLAENLSPERIFVTGNTIVDAVLQNIKLAEKKEKNESILDKMGIEKQQYVLLTLHRQENVDDKERFRNILRGLEVLHHELKVNIIYPIHPRTEKMLNLFHLKLPEGVVAISPVGFLDFLTLEKNAKLILTDSGGVQEEACILNVPCVTLRNNTERPETVEVGSNIVAGTDSVNIVECSKRMLNINRNWTNPFGDGRAAENIISIIQRDHHRNTVK